MALSGIGLALVTAPAARAEPDLAGRWDSDSLRDNRIGYFFELASVPGAAGRYSGVLRFEFRDGRAGSRTPVLATIAGNRVRIVTRQGSFDRSDGVLRGVLDQSGQVLTLTNCQARLRLVMANDLDSDCTFRAT